MKKIARLMYFIYIFVTIATTVSCMENSSERTTKMTSNISETTQTTDVITENNPIPIEFSEVEIINEVIKVDQMLELALYENPEKMIINTNYNPYDYQKIKVIINFSKPSGETISQTAFWYRDYLEVKLIGEVVNEFGYYTDGQEYLTWNEGKENHYRVRINPDEAGLWEYNIEIKILGETYESLTGSFTVTSSEDRTNGYIKVDKTNNRNFIFSRSKTTYVPMGVNLAWPSTSLSTHDYHNWFKHLNENNNNMARIWLASWSYSLHKYSYDNFDSRQNTLARLDYLFQTAKQQDIYIMITLLNHGQFSAITNPEWAENPYNSVNGGMLDYPVQFFYNEEAIYYYQNELMYLISRFGYSENIFAWELFNETDWVDGYSSQIVTRWKDKMATFLHENDPYNHLVTTSYKYTFGTPAFALKSLDFCTFHSYEYDGEMYYEKMIGDLTSLWDKFQKPVLFGEVGIDWQAGDSTYSSDYLGVTIRQGLWGGMMSGAGGSNQWWWDSWIANHNLWDRFLGAGTYSTYLDLANKNYSLIQENENVSTSDEDIHVIGYILDDAIYGYIYNNMWNYWYDNLQTITNVSISIPMNNDNYTLSVFDTETGNIIYEIQVQVTNGIFTLDNLEIEEDYAFILR